MATYSPLLAKRNFIKQEQVYHCLLKGHRLFIYRFDHFVKIIFDCESYIINYVNTVHYYRKLTPESREIEEKLRPLMQFQSHPIAHDLMVQGLIVQLELRKKIEKLKEYRRNGVTTARGADLYNRVVMGAL